MATRKPKIYLAVSLPILVFGGLLCVTRLMSYYAVSKGIPLAAVPNATGMLIALPALFVWIPISLLISNIVIELVSPLREIARRYASDSGTPGFVASQFQLFLVLVIVSAVCVPLIVYGFTR